MTDQGGNVIARKDLKVIEVVYRFLVVLRIVEVTTKSQNPISVLKIQQSEQRK
jgi:hypothetical protein